MNMRVFLFRCGLTALLLTLPLLWPLTCRAAFVSNLQLAQAWDKRESASAKTTALALRPASGQAATIAPESGRNPHEAERKAK